jgi:hypothetical protein
MVPDPKAPGDPPRDLDEVLSELAIKIERVKTLYEQYFMGIEKIPPETARKEVARALLTLQQQQIRNTGLRFRFNTMLQKWNIYMTYWNRTVREIEAGTYLPHIQKARRAAERAGKELPDELKRKRRGSSGELSALPSMPAVAPALTPPQIGYAPAPPPGSAPPPLPSRIAPASAPHFGAPPPAPANALAAAARAVTTPPPAIPGMSESELRALHKKYVDARAAAGEAGQVSYQSLVNSLAKQVPRLLEQPGVRAVRFDVAVQNGKAVLKAFPKK